MIFRVILPLIFYIILFAQNASAFDEIFARYCADNKVPKELAMAIARHESGMKPLCINVAGKDYQPQSREEAIKIIREAQARNKSYDVGLMQINSQWLKRWNLDPVDLLEPETNIRIGVQLLREEIERHGLNWRAIGKYHSPNPVRGSYYAGMVTRQIKGNPELKSRLGNPRLHGALLPPRLRHFKPLPPFSMGDLGQPHLQRSPIAWEKARASNPRLFPRKTHRRR